MKYRASLWLFGALMLGCSRDPVEPEDESVVQQALERGRRDVVLIVTDGLRRDHLSVYGGAQDPMPTLTEFAQEAVVFNDALSASTGTLSSMVSLFTGVSPHEHRVASVHDLGQTRLPDGATTLAESFAAAGYRTLAGFARPLLSEEVAGLAQGFERVLSPGLHASSGLTAQELFWRVRPTLQEFVAEPEPFFLCLVFSDALRDEPAPGDDGPAFLRAHLQPFGARRADLSEALGQLEEDAQKAQTVVRRILARSRGSAEYDALLKATHDGNLLHLDRHLAELFELLTTAGRWRDSVVVVAGSRGSAFAGERVIGRADFPAVLITLPLIMRVPGLHARRESTPVSILDLAPTLADLCELDAFSAADGNSLFPLLEQGGTSTQGTNLLRSCWSSGLDRRALFGRELQWEERLSGEALIFDRASGRAVRMEDAQARWPAEVREADRRFGGKEARERWILRHSGSEGTTLDVEWRFLRGHARGVASEGEGILRQGGRGDNALRGSARLGEGEARLEWHGVRRDLPVGLRLTDLDGRALDDRIDIGAAPLSEHPIPRVPSRTEEAWPTTEDGPAPWRADFTHEGESWWRLHVPRIPDQAAAQVRVLLARHPPSHEDERLEVTSTAGKVEVVPGRMDAVWVTGPVPLAIDVEKKPSEGLALSIAIDGRQVPVRDMRWRGRRFAPTGEIELYLPDWMPQVTDALDRRAAGELALERGRMQLLRRTSGMPPQDRSPLDPEALRAVRFLPADE